MEKLKKYYVFYQLTALISFVIWILIRFYVIYINKKTLYTESIKTYSACQNPEFGKNSDFRNTCFNAEQVISIAPILSAIKELIEEIWIFTDTWIKNIIFNYFTMALFMFICVYYLFSLNYQINNPRKKTKLNRLAIEEHED